jgi:polar amino acid transport system substrate-binding protein
MKLRQRIFSLWISAGMLVGVVFSPCSTRARDLNASLAYLPSLIDSSGEGPFVDLVKAIDGVYTEGAIHIAVYPFARSLYNVVTGNSDFHLPMARNPLVSEAAQPYRYVSEKMGQAVFVIYSHKDKPISQEDILRDKSLATFPYRLETERGLENYFDFPVSSSSTIAQSMKKIEAHRIDGFIWPQEEADFVIKNLQIKTIHREFYGLFDDVIVIPTGPRGDEVDRILSQALRTLRSTGRLQVLYEKIHRPYHDWQPYQEQ